MAPSEAAPSLSSFPARRSSRRSTSVAPNGGLSGDETAFGVLRQYVLEGAFVPVADPENVMTKIWIRDGKDQEEEGHGIDWVKEDGFTVEKYEHFWRTEMADHDDVIVNWGHKLPPEAKAHIPKERFAKPSGVEVSEESGKENEGSSGSERKARSLAAKKTRKKTPGAKGVAGRRKRAKKEREKERGVAKSKKKTTSAADAGASDDEDGLPFELIPSRREWFDALRRGRDEVAAAVADDEVPPAPSLEEEKDRAQRALEFFVMNVARCPRVKEHKRASLDAVAGRVIGRVDAYVGREALRLRDEILQDLRLTNYGMTKDADGIAAAAEEEKERQEEEGAAADEQEYEGVTADACGAKAVGRETVDADELLDEGAQSDLFGDDDE